MPVDVVIADPKTDRDTSTKLSLACELCKFAGKELHLPAEGQYTCYADLGRLYVVWNVFATPEFSLEPKTWWYPILGKLAYRGHFAEDEAHTVAAEFHKEGFDVYIGTIEVYSSLGSSAIHC